MRLPHSEFLSDEAVLDHLVNVFLFSEWALIVEIHIPHLLTDIRLMDILWVVTDEAVVDKALSNEATVDSIGVRCGGSLLVAAWLNLILAEKNTLAMYLLEGNVCR